MKTKETFRSLRTMSVLVPSVLCAFSFFSATAQAVQFAGGTGEPNNPYQIATAEQLIGISGDLNLYNKCFVLTADIDLDPRLPGRKVFDQAVLQWSMSSSYSTPFGPRVTVTNFPFAGRFDGNGHAISHCTIYGTSSGGLFLEIGAKSTVCNVHLQDAFVGNVTPPQSADSTVVFVGKTGSSNLYHGALAATNQGYVNNCSATGTIEGQVTAGGLIGRNTGLVSDCNAACRVFAYRAGGLVGLNDKTGTALSCVSTGAVYGLTNSGGLVASNAGIVQGCKVEGYVWGEDIGGMVGDNSGTVRESCAVAILGSSSADSKPSALVFRNSGTVIDCYTTGVTPSGTLGDGLVSVNTGTVLTSYSTMVSLAPADASTVPVRSAGPAVRYVYYLDPNKSQEQISTPTGYSCALPLTPDEMKQQASFFGFDFTDTWTICEARDYPRLKWEEAACES